jgi:hypothetical protein
MTHTAIINGKIVPYDCCNKVRDIYGRQPKPPSHRYDKKVWEYIGTGEVYSVNEVKQSGGYVAHFYRKVEI